MSAGIAISSATEGDVPHILEIYNHAVLNTTASWDYEEQTLEYRLKWYTEARQAGYPIIIARDSSGEDNAILGAAWLSPFRPKIGYKYCAENSVYVSHKARGRGVGKALLQETLTEASKMGLRVIVAGMDGANETSIKMHAKAGFVETGRMPNVGYKFGKWLDLVLMQIELEGGPGGPA